MEIADLYRQLKEAYCEETLHGISTRIIDLFREKRYDSLKAIQRVVNEHEPCNEEKANRLFSRLIMIYHPDRLRQNLDRIEAAYRSGDFETLYAMSHILQVRNMDPGQVMVSEVLTEEDLAEEFGWESGADGYSYFQSEETYTRGMWEDEYGEDYDGDGFQGGAPEGGFYQEEEQAGGPSFLTVLKRRVYGNLNVDFPMHLLEDLEEIEMADSALCSLEGIDACRQARALDLSNNQLSDLSDLRFLPQMERLYLANNHIGLIDALSNLTVLQVLDLSYNEVDDLSPLFGLRHLDYLNVMGNRVPPWQLERLQLRGVTIIY